MFCSVIMCFFGKCVSEAFYFNLKFIASFLLKKFLNIIKYFAKTIPYQDTNYDSLDKK